MPYQKFGSQSLQALFAERVVYRNLVPADEGLPGYAHLRNSLGLVSPWPPRKNEPEYGRVIAEIIAQARRQELPASKIQRVVYIGDTQMNDGTAFDYICLAGGWSGWAFIGKDAPHQSPKSSLEGSLYIANRWSALDAFEHFLNDRGFPLDENTAIVIDVDKTAVGGRGRNDAVIDAARLEAVERTVMGLLGEGFSQDDFLKAYAELNQPAYHTFTGDNQDYLAYICLVLGAEFYTLRRLVNLVSTGKLHHFKEFIAQVEARLSELDPGLRNIHADIWERVQAGDPTPFKAFRHNEYLGTASRFGELPGAPVNELLQRRIAITKEVLAFAQVARENGALIFGLSDKPDEASLPSPELEAAGMQPLHRINTIVVGST